MERPGYQTFQASKEAHDGCRSPARELCFAIALVKSVYMVSDGEKRLVGLRFSKRENAVLGDDKNRTHLMRGLQGWYF